MSVESEEETVLNSMNSLVITVFLIVFLIGIFWFAGGFDAPMCIDAPHWWIGLENGICLGEGLHQLAQQIAFWK